VWESRHKRLTARTVIARVMSRFRQAVRRYSFVQTKPTLLVLGYVTLPVTTVALVNTPVEVPASEPPVVTVKVTVLSLAEPLIVAL
jgi:hypothetical protein